MRNRIEGLGAPGARRGAGLLELGVVLLLLGLLTAAGLAGVGRLRDHWGARGAREAVAALVREARGRAVARGGATLSLTASAGRAVLRVGGLTLRSVHLRDEFGVGLDLGGAETVDLTVDAAGVGRMSARTVHFTRGRARTRLVISAYGRVRR